MLEGSSALSPEDKWTYRSYARWEGGTQQKAGRDGETDGTPDNSETFTEM